MWHDIVIISYEENKETNMILVTHAFCDSMNFCPPGAYPRRILQVMNIPELTRENVASHLQVHYYFKVEGVI